MRIVSTPLTHAVPKVAPRRGGFPAGLLDAVVRVPGVEPLLDRLRHPDVLVVTTGQQPGLFTGPLYTVYKALSASVVARRLEAAWNRPVVPLFWAAGDDHDYQEAQATSVLDAGGQLVTLSLPDRDESAPLTPMWRVPLGAEVAGLLETLGASLPESPFRSGTTAWLGRHYTESTSVAGAFAGAIAELLEPFGIPCLDATHPSVKQAMAPFLVEALTRSAELDRALEEQAEALLREGHPVPVPVGQGASLVFLEGAGGRDRLVLDDGGLSLRRSGERFALAELEALATMDPERLSPNVLLRPVLESAILPTVAYVAGPGELRYLRMCPPLYQRLGVHRQEPVPRWSGVVVEARVDRVLTKFGATLEELLAPGQALEARVVRSQVPESLVEAAGRLRSAIEQEYGGVLRAAIGVDPTLERPVQSARHHALTELEGIERKVQGHLKKREATELAQIARAREAVLPGGKPQERVLNVAGWLARYGPSFLDEVVARIDEWYPAALAGGGPPS